MHAFRKISTSCSRFRCLQIPPQRSWKSSNIHCTGNGLAFTTSPCSCSQSGKLSSAEDRRLDSHHLAGCLHEKAPLKVAVLLSGGVDSSLALALLHAAGHKVHAFYLQIWFHEDFRNTWDSCPWEEDLQYAQEEMQSGRTPNPDVLCNSRIKFGVFLEHIQKHYSGFDRVASGHYARVEWIPSDSPHGGLCEDRTGTTLTNLDQYPQLESKRMGSGNVQLKLSPDSSKDQTYFLANLSQKQLQQILFPLGTLTKPQVRSLAAKVGLPTMARKDSQGICFLGKVKFSEFIKEHLGEWPGPIIEEESGQVVAMHRGFWFYTIGQRTGLNVGHLENGPWYVVRKEPMTNALYISLDYFSEDKRRDTFTCGQFNWINEPPSSFADFSDGEEPANVEPQLAAMVDNEGFTQDKLYVKVRHGPSLYTCRSFLMSDDLSTASVQLDRNDQGLAAGQFAVFYQNTVCLGCGIIQ